MGHFEDHVLTLAFTTSGLAGAFGRADHSENLRQAIHKTIGIECQITAVASGSNSAASSEPNPKAPVSRDVPATSTDADWGLPPADVPAQPAPAQSAPSDPEPPQTARAAQASPTPASAADPAIPAAPAAQAAPTQAPASPAAPAQAPVSQAPSPAPETVASGMTPSAAPANEPQGAPSEAAGSYAYPDDDWGPPRDEDAPPLDEEPPMDWDPSAPPVVRSVQPAAAPAGQRKAAPARSRAASKPAPANDPAPQGPDTANDPWARAVEEAPGIWAVGTASNRREPPAGGVRAARPSPHLSRNRRTTNPRRPRSRTTPQQCRLPPRMNPSSPHRTAGETPPSWCRPALHPLQPRQALQLATAAPSTISAPASPAEPAPTGRQSLYQRLSNSPEAEAGRAKAPARAAATTTYVQDIPSADDETIEESGVFGRAAVERILGGKLVEERSLDGSPLPPRF